MNDEKIALYLADDNEMVVDGIKALVEGDPTIEVVGRAENGLEVADKVDQANATVLVCDISLPGMNGLEVCRSVKARTPDVAVLMLSMNASERIVAGALANGASGYLVKESVASELCKAIHAVARGETYLGQGIPDSVLKASK
jgi:DNA-binding NarL/FixJ family response regulator